MVMKQAINGRSVFRFLTKPCHDIELALAIREGLDAHVNLQALLREATVGE